MPNLMWPKADKNEQNGHSPCHVQVYNSVGNIMIIEESRESGVMLQKYIEDQCSFTLVNE